MGISRLCWFKKIFISKIDIHVQSIQSVTNNGIRARVCMCVYSNSRNDVTRVAQWYETIAAHTRRRASVVVVFVVFCMHMYSFAGLIRRTPPPTFSDTAITDRHSDTTIFQLGAPWVRISWSVRLEKSFGHVPPGGSRTLDFLRARRAPYPLGQALRGIRAKATAYLYSSAPVFYQMRTVPLDTGCVRLPQEVPFHLKRFVCTLNSSEQNLNQRIKMPTHLPE